MPFSNSSTFIYSTWFYRGRRIGIAKTSEALMSMALFKRDETPLLRHWSFVSFVLSHRCYLTHWGRVTHICDGKLTIIDSDNGLLPGRPQAIIGTNAGILLIGPLGTNFNEILIGIQTFSFKKMHFKMSSAKWRPFCLGLSVLNVIQKAVPCGHAMLWYLWEEDGMFGHFNV